MFVWAGCATTPGAHDDGDMHAPMTQHYDDSVFKVTEKGEFSVEVLFPDKKIEMGVNNIDLIIHNKMDKDVAGADITVAPWMPSMDHGVMARSYEMGAGGYFIRAVDYGDFVKTIRTIQSYWNICALPGGAR